MREADTNGEKREIEAHDIRALRTCASICWLRRDELQLDDKQLDDVLVAWMAVGTREEGTAASEVVAARRAAALKQATFDGLLGG